MNRLIFITIFIFVLGFAAFAQEQKDKTEGSGTGSGMGSGKGTESRNSDGLQTKQTSEQKITPKTNSGVRILSKPRPVYTDIARQNQVQGRVILRVTFKKNSEIGKIKVVSGLPDGLSNSAIKAAKQIRFEPQIKNGKPVTVKKNIEYTFTLY